MELSCDEIFIFQEIPEDELELGKDEMLVPVAHFNKVKILWNFLYLIPKNRFV